MNREAFKQRMQQLKQYREQNPGNTYLDFKKYAEGGETGDDDKELKRALNIATHVLKYGKPLTEDSKVIDNYTNNVLWTMENPASRGLNNELYYTYTDKGVDGVTRKNIGPGIESHSNMAKQLKYDNSTGYSKDELNQLVSEDLRKATPKIVESLNRMKDGQYYGVWDTLSTGPKMVLYDIYHNVKSSNKKNLPEKWSNLVKALAEGNLEEAKKQTYSGSTRRQKMRNQLVTYNDIDSVANYAQGGEVPPNKDKPYKDRYGKRYTQQEVDDYYSNSTDEIDRFTGRPMSRGLKSVIDLEDAMNATPVGDAISVYDMYDAAKNKDWGGVGLAALSLVPFVPMTVKQFRSKYKGITPKTKNKNKTVNSFNTTVNKNYVQDRINEYANREAKVNAKLSKAANQTYNVAERLMDDPEYLIRANQVKKQFGDDYTTVYADIIDKYNNDPFSLPNIESFDGGSSRAQLRSLGNGKYSYRIDPNKANLDLPVTEHELSHYTDFKRNKDRLDPHGDSNMFYQMSKDLKDRSIDSWDWYYIKPTEQKAHMNQLREYMFQNGMISTRGQTVSAKMMKNVLDQMSKIDSMKEVARASKQFNNINKYTKWFNSIPLLGVGAAAVYKSKEE